MLVLSRIVAFVSRTGQTGHVDVIAVVAFSYAVSSAWFTSVLLTGSAAYRRGLTGVPVLLAGMFFPVTWTVWRVQDQRLLRIPRRAI